MPEQAQTIEQIAEQMVAREKTIEDAIVLLSSKLSSANGLSTVIEQVIDLMDGRMPDNHAEKIGRYYWRARQKSRFSKRKVLAGYPVNIRGRWSRQDEPIIVDPRNQTASWHVFEELLPKFLDYLT